MFLDTLLRCVQDYKVRMRVEAEPKAGHAAVKLFVKHCKVHYDLLPAIAIYGFDGVHLVPFGGDHPDAWRIVRPAQLKENVLVLEDHCPGIRHCIRVVKFLNGVLGWQLPSFAIVCAVWARFRQGALTFWKNLDALGPWARLYAVVTALYNQLATGQVPHMFGGLVLDEIRRAVLVDLSLLIDYLNDRVLQVL